MFLCWIFFLFYLIDWEIYGNFQRFYDTSSCHSVKEKPGMRTHEHKSLLKTSFCLSYPEIQRKMLIWGFRSREKFKSQFGIFHVFSSPFQSGENPSMVLPCGFVSCSFFTLLILIFQDLTFMFTSRLMCKLKPRESLLCFETFRSLKSWGLTVFIHSKENTLLVWKFPILMGFWTPSFSWIIQEQKSASEFNSYLLNNHIHVPKCKCRSATVLPQERSE